MPMVMPVARQKFCPNRVQELKWCIRMTEKLKRAQMPFRAGLELQALIRGELETVYGSR